jgi:type VI secretion system protein ImpM
VQLGVLGPSCDRVGRYYPVCAIVQFAHERFDNAMLAHCDALYGRLGQVVLGAVRHACTVEQLSERLNGALVEACLPADAAPAGRGAWPELAAFFDPLGATSFWWTNRGDGSPLQTVVHTGALDNSLFARLFGPQYGQW